MSLTASLLSLALLLFLSAVFSGSEIGFYGLSRVRLEADVREGKRLARWVRGLVSGERAFLITILIGNNLVLELATGVGEDFLSRIFPVPESLREVLLTVLLTPLLFLFGELLPKDIFRRKPHTLLGIASPLLFAARILFLPLALPLFALGAGIERLLRFERQEVSKAFGREVFLSVLDEGTRLGSIPDQTRALAENALSLTDIPIKRVMIPWDEVERLDSNDGPDLVRDRAADFEHTRAPISNASGSFDCYLHQLDVLACPASVDPRSLVRELPCLPPELGVDAALHRMRIEGGRIALVGDPAKPLGLLALKDLVEEISGELAGW